MRVSFGIRREPFSDAENGWDFGAKSGARTGCSENNTISAPEIGTEFVSNSGAGGLK
ncbi:hypothetical protein [Marimonas arenosa]|uniref:Uncharacterized protein n=1 Tax=Marimonas arenosa TaxID=1795305 RepID=A0AAE3WCF5_9RHOB|nr:hypothetical protein [Marimonas arenosa]MDQ2090159.1 hypothetical protein [Marimonas arenosa]